MTVDPRIKAALIGLALLGGAFAAGRYSAPPDVREVERVEFRDRVVEVIREVKVKQAAEIKTVVVYREKVTKPDGTVIEKETSKADTETKTAETVKTDTSKDATSEGTREVERIVSAPRPAWRVGALAGGSLTPALVPAYGAHVERRILGPFSVGVWGLNSGQAGVSLSVEF